jgi:hypothetical protein
MSDSNNSNDDPQRSAGAAPPPPPSFLKRNVIDENTGISFGGPDARTSIPEATRRVGGGISFSTFPSSASVMPSFAPPSSMMTMGPTMQAVSGKAAPLEALPNANRKAEEGDWLLTKAPTLPQFHPLERTATFVPHVTDVSLVSSRISRVLRDRSIEASYDSAKAKVRCASMDGVDFRIRLYRGRTSQYSHGIIVEVQRRFGMSFTYHHDTQAILDAAHGKAVISVPPPPASASANGALVLPLVSDAEDVSGTDSDQDEAATVPPPLPSTSSMAMVATMFAHSDYSSQFLAYQTLIPLTSAARMGRSTAKSVATQLLQPGNPVGAKVLDAILMSSGSTSANKNQNNKRAYRGTLEYESDDEDGSGSSTLNDDAQYEMKLQTMAWTVLSNAVHATKGQAVTTTLREELRPALLQALEDAASNPRHAQMAALCAEYVCMDDTGDEDDLVDALEQAVQVGRIKHAGLKAQAQRCLDKVRRAA